MVEIACLSDNYYSRGSGDNPASDRSHKIPTTVHKYGKGSFIKYVKLEGEGAQEFVAVCDRLRVRTWHCVARVVEVIHVALAFSHAFPSRPAICSNSQL